MKTFARLVDGMAIDVITGDPKEMFHPDLAKDFVEVPTGTLTGSCLSKGKWIAPVIEQQVIIAPPIILNPVNFKLLFSMKELVAIKTCKDPMVAAFMSIIDDPRITEVNVSANSTKEAVELMAKLGLIAEDRVAEILSNKTI